jgi:hypothetical protein
LFDDYHFPYPEAALDHDKGTHNFDLFALSARLGLFPFPILLRRHSFVTALDTHQRLRLINYIRSQVST